MVSVHMALEKQSYTEKEIVLHPPPNTAIEKVV